MWILLYRFHRIYNCKKKLEKEKVSLAFRLKMTDEAKNYLLEKIKQNELMSEKH